MTDSPHLPQEDWSDFAGETGPDTQQPDMVSRSKAVQIARDYAERRTDLREQNVANAIADAIEGM